MSTEQSTLGRCSVLDAALFEYLIARIVFYEPKTATSLLQVNSSFQSATARALYDEIYVQDDEDALRSPPACSRLESILAYPKRYAAHVRTLVLIPFQGSRDHVESEGDQRDGITSESLGRILSLLPNLEAFVWATNRMPIRNISSVLHKSCPEIADIAFRPTTSDLAHSYTRTGTQEGATTTILQRWDGFMLQSLSNLKSLSISGLSQEGIRELEKLLVHSKRLQRLSVDSQFVDDSLLFQAASLKQLRSLLIKSSGTKMTDKGILAILENSDTLQDLTLTEVEGRLNKSFWTKAACLPPLLQSIRIAFNEDNPHHSWVSDHLNSVFEVLESASGGLRSFTVTRLMPKGEVLPVAWNSQEGMILNNGNGDFEQGMMLKRVFHHACDDVVSPRDLPLGGITRIIDFGSNLRTLEVDFFTMDLDDLKKIVEGCSKLEYLRVLIDAPLPKILGLSSSFVTLTNLHTFVLGITDAHCPQQALIAQPKAKGKGTSSTPSSPIASRSARQNAAVPMPMSPAQSEPDPISPSSSPRTPLLNTHRRSLSSSAGNVLQNFNKAAHPGLDDFSTAGLQGPRGSVGTFDTSVPPKRDIRKFAKRCPSLRVIRWIGRNGKGEWRIAAGTSSIHTHIEFTPIHQVVDEESEQLTLSTGADVEKFIVTRRSAHLPHPGKRVEDFEAAASLAADALAKNGELKTPRIDGRVFPRLKVSAGSSSKVGETQSISADDTSRQKKASPVEQKSSTKTSIDQGAQPVTKLADSIPITSPKVKTYAAASDPKSPSTIEDGRKKNESKMTVLGESNGKKQSKTSLESSKTASKPRLDPRPRGTEEVINGSGQAKIPSLTSGAAGRRKRNKAAAAAASTSANKSGDTSTSKRADPRRGTKSTRG